MYHQVRKVKVKVYAIYVCNKGMLEKFPVSEMKQQGICSLPTFNFFFHINCIFRKRGGGWGGGGGGYTAPNWLTLNMPGSTPTPTKIDVMSMCSTLLYSVDMQTVTVQKHTPMQQT